MTLPVVPGNSMSFSQINTELSLSSTATISLNDAAVRTLAGVGASPATISITNLSGKSNEFTFSITSNQTNANLRTLALAAGWPGTAKVVATINSGIYISSNSTGTAGLTINGSFPNGVSLVNNGFIVGMGGGGGNGAFRLVNTVTGAASGASGGLALAVTVAVTITNGSGTIGGGGGGGGGGGYGSTQAGISLCATIYNVGGSGGGGGRTGTSNSSGGSGGAGTGFDANPPGLDGAAGTNAGGGAGGASQTFNNGFGSATGAAGGTGGTWGSSGASGGNGSGTGGSGSSNGAGGGGAGACISGNSNITYVTTGTRLGAIT